MCGINGFLDTARQTGHDELIATVRRMADTLRHRGPDDSGAWADAETGVALGHRRLSIVDLSPAGHQPMHSASGRYVIIFNGEIYNFQPLRQELERLGCRFRGHSDTEVMLSAVEQWGLVSALERFNGMFAFALWDRQTRQLSLARDRLGEKPLYYGWMDKTFLFASELKALRAHPAFRANINRDALALYLRHNYIPAPHSIYSGIYKLPPGMLLTVSCEDGAPPAPRPYWSAKHAAERGVAQPFTGSPAEAVEQLDALLRDAVRMRMVADVPLGAFLSGGIDSSTVVALMQAQSGQPIRTFSIGFYEEGYNEAVHAKAVARHLGTDHTELYVSPDEAMAVIPRLPALYDEPFSDSSQIPTLLVSELARRHVTVSLSGDGGDELFAGYSRYAASRDLWGKVGWIPRWGRKAVASTISSAPARLLDAGFAWLSPALSKYGRKGDVGEKLHKVAEILGVDGRDALYLRMISHWKQPSTLVLGSRESPTAFTEPSTWPRLHDFTDWMMYLDTITYLPDDILLKVDRASMGVSLEGRIPLLDHRVVEFAWQLPVHMKIMNGQSKWPLRQVLYRYVPRELIERPKMGFAVPIHEWLRGPLREWAETLLDEQRLRHEGFFDAQAVRQKWNEHCTRQRNWQYHLWDVLMFEAWLEHTTKATTPVSSSG